MAAKQEAKKLANSVVLSKASDQQHYSCYYYIRVPIVEQQYSEQRPASPPPYDVLVNNIPALSSPPGSSKPRRLRKCISCKCYCFDLVLAVGILCLVAMGLILWLSQPKLDVVRVHLNHMNIISCGGACDGGDDVVFLDASMDLEVRIQKYQDLIPYSYNMVSVFIGYQGVWHQPTMTNERFVDTRDGVSYLEATVGLNGTQQALATSRGHDHYTTSVEGGFVPLDIVVQVGASYHFLYVYIPVQGRISCSVNVDMENQTIASQNCYPLHGIIMDPLMV